MNIHFNVFHSGGDWIVQGIADVNGKRIYSTSFRKKGSRHARQDQWVERQKEEIRLEMKQQQ